MSTMKPLVGVLLVAAVVGVVWLFYIGVLSKQEVPPQQLPAFPSSMQENAPPDGDSGLNSGTTPPAGSEKRAPESPSAKVTAPELEAFKGLEEESSLIQQPPFTDDLLQNVVQ